MPVVDRFSDRFSNLELDLGDKESAPTPAPAPTPTPAPVAASAPRSWASPGISSEGKARAQADEKAAESAGFSLAPPVYEIGSLVNSWGVDNFRASRSEYEAMPTTTEACERLIDLVQAEDRRDFVVEASALRMLPTGELTRGEGKLPVTKRALSGLAGFVTPGGGSYLAQCPTDLRAHNVNHWLERAYQVDARATKRTGATVEKPREITLRTRVNHATGQRENFATVGPRYAAYDIDKIAAQVMGADAIPADARADIVYDGYKSRIDVLFHSDIQPEKCVAGEIFKAGILVKTADDGTGAIQIGAQVWRNLCLNLMIIDHDVLETTRRRHVGRGIAESVEDGIIAAMAKIQHFADAWSAATIENVLEKYGCADVEAVFRGLVFNKVVHVPGVQPAEMHARLMNAWQAEPGYTKTDIVNAVTRAAHAESWRRWEDVEDMERTGGELLFARDWSVEIPDGTRVSF